MHKMFFPLCIVSTLGLPAACHHPEAAFGRRLIECVDLAQTRAEADACRAKVEAEYADASGWTPSAYADVSADASADASIEGGVK